MKKGIHPKYYENAKVKCACGAIFEIGSTREYMEVEICAKCHPFYTKKEKIVDTLGKVEKFKAKLLKSEQLKKKRDEGKNKRNKREAE
jgi:large subunit ribosomal protein L31